MSRLNFFVTAFAGAILVAVAGGAGDKRAHAESLVLEGLARVEDNATLEIWGQRVRLEGVFVPDPESTAGLAGKRFLEGLVAAVRVRCIVSVRTPDTAMPGRCTAGGVDLGEAMAAAGHARAREQSSRR